MDWEKEIEKIVSVHTGVKVFISDLLKSQRQDLLKELRGEVNKLQVKPMEDYLVTGYSDALDDVIKLLESKE
jgi:hypothetical protein